MMERVVELGGQVRCVYGEEMDLSGLGHVQIRRASRVEPDGQARWWADLSPVAGPKLGPYTLRSMALEAEVRWLADHWLAGGR